MHIRNVSNCQAKLDGYLDNTAFSTITEVYLELMAGDKRDQEVAERVKSFLMKDFESVQL